MLPMPRKGLNREAVTAAAIRQIEENGIASFSMNGLARSLGIRTPSLYAHVPDLDALLTDVGRAAVGQMVECERAAIAGKQREQALFALAEAYQTFANGHRELYRLVMHIPKAHNPVLEQAAEEIAEPILTVLSGYGISGEQAIHWQRALRAMMHGFAAHEQCGAFSHSPVSREDSYHMAIQMMADSLQRTGEGGAASHDGIGTGTV